MCYSTGNCKNIQHITVQMFGGFELRKTPTDKSLHHDCNHREGSLSLPSYHGQFLVVDPQKIKDPHIAQERGQSGH